MRSRSARLLLRRAARIAAVAVGAMAVCAPSPAAASGAWRWPVDGAVVTAFANGGGPYAAGQHRGIDVAARPGVAVVAAAGGIVRFAGRVGSSGLTVSMRTTDGRFDVSYLHLAAIGVTEGDVVPAGARVGTAGTSGRPSSSTPHLHLGVRDAGTRSYRDPLTLLPPRPAVRDLPRGAPVPVRIPVRPQPRAVPVRVPVRAVPRAVPVRPRPRSARVPVRVRPRSGPVPVTPGLARVRPAHLPGPIVGRGGTDRRGWAVACAALLAATALLGAGMPRGGRGEQGTVAVGK